jgi:hypothetical protein
LNSWEISDYKKLETEGKAIALTMHAAFFYAEKIGNGQLRHTLEFTKASPHQEVPYFGQKNLLRKVLQLTNRRDLDRSIETEYTRTLKTKRNSVA